MSQRDAFSEDHVNAIWADRIMQLFTLLTSKLSYSVQIYTIWVMLIVCMYNTNMPLICEHQYDNFFKKQTCLS